jgi:hypothetical protein
MMRSKEFYEESISRLQKIKHKPLCGHYDYTGVSFYLSAMQSQ